MARGFKHFHRAERVDMGVLPNSFCPKGATRDVSVILRTDAPSEVDYFFHGGLLTFVFRQLLAA